jgi:hypothetical protein
MKLITAMKRIKELDQQIAAVQKEDINFDTLCSLFEKTKRQANFMMLFLKKCKNDGYDFEESQYLLEGYMMNQAEIGDEVRDMVSGDEGVLEFIELKDKELWVTFNFKEYKLDDIEVIE